MAENQEIIERLERIEKGLLAQSTVLTFPQFCKYVGISHSHGYKLTSEREVPHYCPNGKKLFFDKTEIDSWLLRNRVATTAELQGQVSQRGGANR